MKKGKEELEEAAASRVLDEEIWDCGSSLYDSHELISIARVIDSRLMVIPFLNGTDVDDDHALTTKETQIMGQDDTDKAGTSGAAEKRLWKKVVKNVVGISEKNKCGNIVSCGGFIGFSKK